MSRIGKKNIILPPGVEARIEANRLIIQGPKGTLNLDLHPQIKVKQESSSLVVTVANSEEKKNNSLWGLHASLIKNMIEGVVKGYEKKLEMNGIGFKAEVRGKNLVLDVGYSHSVNFPIPEGLEIFIDKNIITVKGISKQLVGNIAAEIRRVRPPEPYKGSGIKYLEEKIRRKAGKAAVKAAV